MYELFARSFDGSHEGNKIAEENKMSSANVKNWIRKGCCELKNEVMYRNSDLYGIFDEMKNS